MKKLCYLALLSMFLALPAFAQSGSYSITIAPAPIVLTPPPGPLAGGQVGVPYGPVVITISGGTPPYTATVTTGSLPPGVTMTVSGSTITLAGTPTSAGTDTFVITPGSSGTNVARITHEPATLRYKPTAPTPYVEPQAALRNICPTRTDSECYYVEPQAKPQAAIFLNGFPYAGMNYVRAGNGKIMFACDGGPETAVPDALMKEWKCSEDNGFMICHNLSELAARELCNL